MFYSFIRATKRLRSPLVWGMSVCAAASLLFAPAAHADRFDNQINNLKQKNSQSVQVQQQLKSEVNNLGDVIAAQQAEIAALEAQMSGTQAKIAQVQSDIARAEAELAAQRALLATNLHQMYIDSGITTLEMLASSKNFSDFVDQSQYHISLQQKVQTTLDKIKQLKSQLEAEKKQTEQLLADQQAMQVRLEAQKAENSRLMQLKTDQQAAYNQDIAANNTKIAQLRAAQAKENSRGFVSKPSPVQVVSHGSYPWADVPFPNSLSDPWGMYKRQCVSYTAWKVASSGRHMPYWGGRGDAKEWDDNARAEGIPVDGRPRVGDVAISNAGAYGHAMYVEAVHNDGIITVSQYNAGWDGRYSEGRRTAAGLSFIHF